MVAVHLWPAVHALRQAEALAALGTVSGPADEPPQRPEDENGWARDWLQRAKDALGKAREMADRKSDTLRERARSIAGRITEGARTIVRGAKSIARDTLDELRRMQETAQSLANAWSGTQAVIVVAAIIGAVWYFTKRHRAA